MKWIDPPSGWRYGFPKKVLEDVDLAQLLLDSEYPKEDIDFALQHMRSWPVDVKCSSASGSQ